MEKYIKTGKCIWCGKEEPEATFYTEPHILPHSLGGLEIGFDICDECNHYLVQQLKENLVLTWYIKR